MKIGYNIIFSVFGLFLRKGIIKVRVTLFQIYDQLNSILIFMDKQPKSTEKMATQIHTQKQLWKNNYPWYLCLWESTYLSFSLYLWYLLVKETVKDHQGPMPTLTGFIVAQLLVDFVSGVVHWAADTWGKFQTPIFGPTIIYSFRKHHVDPHDIVTHGFLETNAASAYPVPIFLGIALATSNGSLLSQTYNWTIIFAVILGILTNQFHKWAHMEYQKPHPIIRFFQKSGLIISHEKHHDHHQGEFNSSYCIINGWMNPFLDRIDFWRKTENLITKITGIKPREDDEYWRQLKAQ